MRSKAPTTVPWAWNSNWRINLIMKPFAKRLLALASAAAITMTLIPAVHGTEETLASEAAPAMASLIPTRMRTADSTTPLTRQDLCGMSMNVYKSLTEQTDEDLAQPDVRFLDTDDADVLNACELELVTTGSNGIFDPEEAMTRQDFYTSAVQLLDTLGYSYIDDIQTDLTAYADSDEIMAYAVKPTQVLLGIGAIEGSELLQPTQQITAEEAVIIMDRVMNFFADWEANPVPPATKLREEVISTALSKVGCRYVSGGHGPSKFDCSGLVYWIYKQYGYDLQPGARNQWSTLDKSVKKADLLPGDLVFFSSNGRASGIFHVGMYIGDGQFVHAANSRKGVIVTDLDEAWYANRYLGAKRAIG